MPALYCLLTVALFIVGLQTAAAQQSPVVQLSGVVVSADSAAGLAGIAVYVPGTKRGTLSRASGFFSLPVLPGDSVVFQALGFEKQFLIIPKTDTPENFTTRVMLTQLVNQLPEVRVIPWPTRQDLKVAVRDLKLPEERTVTTELGPLTPTSIFGVPQMDTRDNGRQGLKHHLNQQQGRFILPTQIRIF
ncbi:carboxypeptidase-like regulatory domain-containing protein [Pontibacter sp. Tf4]|uniref:carboxypeptidase-like regulatory domain-containing protein n=1 Tax=Pontibacter sp. Tf4 TaxID=2761620 RepID=UPI001625F065|nr:carboxypeptidase-like regulatory domain-containing protein [Pontibacter sp. Tf4]MBB6611110.1 carboxypeptidase-like regulatory domain-containing protein [Pontibacter sp. Tf4]